MLKALGLVFPNALELSLALLQQNTPLRKNSSDLFSLLFDEVKHYAIFTVDTKGKITSWNKASQLLFGYKGNEAIGNSLAFLFPDMVKSGHLQEDIEMALEHGQYEHITDIVDKRKKKITVKCVVTSLWGNRQELKGFSKIIEDITPRLEIEKKREELISLAGHELKNPITSIKAYLQLIEMKMIKKNDKELDPFVKKALSQVDKLSNLLKDLLDASKITIGRLPFHDNDTFSLNLFLQEIIENIQFANPDYTIVFSQKPTITLKNVDKERLEQVIVNLLLNAIKYSPKNKKIRVLVQQTRKYIIIRIKDSGIGIAKKDQANIFEKFYRAENAKGIGSGLGLGLHLAQEIISHYHGEIALQSQKGKGSTFILKLPQQV